MLLISNVRRLTSQNEDAGDPGFLSTYPSPWRLSRSSEQGGCPGPTLLPCLVNTCNGFQHSQLGHASRGSQGMHGFRGSGFRVYKSFGTYIANAKEPKTFKSPKNHEPFEQVPDDSQLTVPSCGCCAMASAHAQLPVQASSQTVHSSAPPTLYTQHYSNLHLENPQAPKTKPFLHLAPEGCL